ncbi:Transcription factor [Dimargaris cristalligena]|nr:Transcription factor [Dimargaris cristalligena]
MALDSMGGSTAAPSSTSSTKLEYEPNPFEQSFSTPVGTKPPPDPLPLTSAASNKPILPPVSHLESPSIPGSQFWKESSLRLGPLSPSMLQGPQGIQQLQQQQPHQQHHHHQPLQFHHHLQQHLTVPGPIVGRMAGGGGPPGFSLKAMGSSAPSATNSTASSLALPTDYAAFLPAQPSPMTAALLNAAASGHLQVTPGGTINTVLPLPPPPANTLSAVPSNNLYLLSAAEQEMARQHHHHHQQQQPQHQPRPQPHQHHLHQPPAGSSGSGGGHLPPPDVMSTTTTTDSGIMMPFSAGLPPSEFTNATVNPQIMHHVGSTGGGAPAPGPYYMPTTTAAAPISSSPPSSTSSAMATTSSSFDTSAATSTKSATKKSKASSSSSASTNHHHHHHQQHHLNHYPASEADGGEGGGDEKRRSFLERNRIAALKCRQRKKQWLNNLQNTLDLYSVENDKAEKQMQLLREEVLHLKTLLVAHKECPVAQANGVVGLNNFSPFANANVSSTNNNSSANATAAAAASSILAGGGGGGSTDTMMLDADTGGGSAMGGGRMSVQPTAHTHRHPSHPLDYLRMAANNLPPSSASGMVPPNAMLTTAEPPTSRL